MMPARSQTASRLSPLLCGLTLALSACLPLSAQAASTEAEALHALNRLSLGPAPGDLAHVMDIGVDRYITEQLHPERLPLPEALQARLGALDTLGWSQRELVERYRQTTPGQQADAPEPTSRRDLVKQVDSQATEARLLRATQSPRQLEEVMVDFWFNHFNVHMGKGLDRVLVGNYEQEAIRPHALGRFRDLLGATAHHPAMLFYLDNWLSVAPGRRAGKGAPDPGKAKGLNENYARELMELHTLGVDGGYTQADVTELARMLTGWTLHANPPADTLFRFDARRHDAGDKTWLGRSVRAQGQAEGEAALDVLARHPATAHRIAFKLAQRFVADAPPPALVDQLAQRFLDTDGDVRAVLQTLFDSPAFRHPARPQALFKTPYEYVVSAVRATQWPLSDAKPLRGALAQLGMPLYGCPTPDGHAHTEAAWLNPEGITRRINFATALASGQGPFKGPDQDAKPIAAPALLDTLGSGISAATRATVAQTAPALRAALVLGSPDFMRH